MFDYKDGNLYWLIKAKNRVTNRPAGFITSHGYRAVIVNQKQYYIHRLVWKHQTGLDPVNIDHINQDKQDNRIENLREVNQSQNGHNAKPPKNNKSGVKGVSWDKYRDKWSAQIKVNYIKIALGRHEDFEKAVEARKKAEIKYLPEIYNIS